MIDTQYEVRRYISVFNKYSELKEKEHNLKGFELIVFQNIFEIEDSENPLFDCYEITEEILEKIKEFVDSEESFDFKQYSYFLESEKV